MHEPGGTAARAGAPAPGPGHGEGDRDHEFAPAEWQRWPEVTKAVALALIVANHCVELSLGAGRIANPTSSWGTFAERARELKPYAAGEPWRWIATVVRWVGWLGDQAVGPFVVVSGFGLAWSALRRAEPARQFYRRRLARLYPLWWATLAAFLLLAIASGSDALSLADGAFWLSAAGIRVTLGAIYYGAGAWWYFTLAVQLYLVFPLLWPVLRRLGPNRSLVAVALPALAGRLVGLLVFTGYLDAWSRGAVFVSRLAEFVVGAALAMALSSRATERTEPATGDRRSSGRAAAVDRALRRPVTVAGWAALYAVGVVLALTLAGMAVAPALLAVAFTGVVYAITGGAGCAARGRGVVEWVGRHSFALYLVHHPIVSKLVKADQMGPKLLAQMAASVAATVLVAVALESLVGRLTRWYAGSSARRGRPRTFARLAVPAVAVVAALSAGELVAQAKAPGEVLGWGERPSLAPSDEFGWTLKPGSTTRLRWLTYDYRVSANSLGFPGPEPKIDKSPGVVRILVTGDAYSSAEGVDTDRSWVAQLGPALAARGVKAEVLDFAITGYGPRQEAAVVAHFAPIYKPDLVIVESFVNDYADETSTDQEFRDGIGFGRPSPTGALSVLRFGNLSAWAGRVRSGEATAFFNGSIFLDQPASLPTAARSSLQHDWSSIAASAAAAGGRAVVLGVPAAAQVCADRGTPEQFASHVPQDAQQADAKAAGMGWIDATAPLRAQPSCPYFAHNLHWVEDGHRAVAAWLAEPGRLIP